MSVEPSFSERPATTGKASSSPAEAGALTKELTERIKPSVGLRNTIVHEYIKVNYEIVAAAVPMALETYTAYRQQMASFVLDRMRPSGG
jgi:uncharacterized protein YutE (UPF0331/DUF86 family)